MSTLKVTTVQDTSAGNSSTTAQIAQGRAKAWINFNGTGTIAARDSFNVSGITDNGTGQYTVTFDTDFANINYAIALTSSTDNGTPNTGGSTCVDQDTLPTVGACKCIVLNTANGAKVDNEVQSAIFFGDQ
tara:strand:- start:261 stop:653 length:393 start_codon:yes stop_codon:yes gene_type:complete